MVGAVNHPDGVEFWMELETDKLMQRKDCLIFQNMIP